MPYQETFPWGLFWLFAAAGVVVVVVGIAAYLWWRERGKKGAAPAEEAQEEFDFEEASPERLFQEFQVFRLERFGDSAHIRNVMRRQRRGEELVLFDLEFRDGEGKSRSQTAGLFSVLYDPFPQFRLLPREAAPAYREGLGIDSTGEVEVPDRQEFQSHFLLAADDADHVRKLFGPNLTSPNLPEFLMGRENRDWIIDCRSEWCLAFRRDRTVAASEHPEFVRELENLRNILLMEWQRGGEITH